MSFIPFEYLSTELLESQIYPEGALYVLATPLGNLADISLRALYILHKVDAVACEDTRHSQTLLRKYGLQKNLFALHQHNQVAATEQILLRLSQGERIALITDAGTPGISDPGSYTVNAAQERGFKIIPVPGACALITALSASGFTETCFYFAGFLPNRTQQRLDVLSALRYQKGSLIFYEAPHRIFDTIAAMQQIFKLDRRIVLAKELTKQFETFFHGKIANALDWLKQNPHHCKGEFVILLEGAAEDANPYNQSTTKVLEILAKELPAKQAARIAAAITGYGQKELYSQIVALKNAI